MSFKVDQRRNTLLALGVSVASCVAVISGCSGTSNDAASGTSSAGHGGGGDSGNLNTSGTSATSGSSNGGGAGGSMSSDINACTGTLVCPAEYPCQDLAEPSQNYTCRGQFADWKPSDSPDTFTENADGTVMDSRNGLLWQQDVDAMTYNFADAQAYCAALSLVGTGWRLPTKAELESIVDFGRSNAAIDPVAFPATPVAYFWSSSPYAVTPGNAWHVNFRDGVSGSGDSDENRVRCVRSSDVAVASTGGGGAPPGRYTIDEVNGTVYDTLTQLTWQREVPGAPTATGCSGQLCTQAGAVAYCTGLSLAGTGWRVPTVSELLTIVDPTQLDPAIGPPRAFPDAGSDHLWSSSAYVGLSDRGWAVAFYSGYNFHQATSETNRVRCVR